MGLGIPRVIWESIFVQQGVRALEIIVKGKHYFRGYQKAIYEDRPARNMQHLLHFMWESPGMEICKSAHKQSRKWRMKSHKNSKKGSLFLKELVF